MSRPQVVRYAPTPAQKAQDAREAQAANEIAAGFVTRLLDDLQGRETEFLVLVARAVFRGLALTIAKRATVARAVGLLSGSISFVCPGYVAEPVARTEADALFARRAA